MRNKLFRYLGFVVIIMSLIIGGNFLQAGQAEASDSEDIYWGPYSLYTTVQGSAAYAMAFGMQKVFAQEDSPLSIKARPSQGMFDRLKNLEREKEAGNAWKYFPILAAADVKNLQEGRGHFEDYPTPDARYVLTFSSSMYGFITFDEDIETIQDLEGKSLAIGKRTQIAYGQQMAQLVEEVAEVPDVDINWVGTGPALKGLQDGQYDASIALLGAPIIQKEGEYTIVEEDAQADTALEEVIHGRKQLYAVDLTKELVEKLCEERNYGTGAFPIRVPAGTINIDASGEHTYWHAMPYGIYTYKDTPAPAVKEFVEGNFKWMDEISQYYSTYKYLEPENLLAGMEWGTLHEGVKQALKEHGYADKVPGYKD